MDEFKLTVEELKVLKNSLEWFYSYYYNYFCEDKLKTFTGLFDKFSEEFMKERQESGFGVTVYLDD